jgi:hypothetical protein
LETKLLLTKRSELYLHFWNADKSFEIGLGESIAETPA